MAAGIMKECDADKSGKISWEEAAACYEKHQDEIEAAAEEHGKDLPTPEEAKEEFQEVAGKDGEVDMKELTKAIRKGMKEHKNEKNGSTADKLAQLGRKMPKAGQMWELLTTLMDQNDDGVIQGQEAEAALEWLNEHGKAVFEHIDANNNGEIDKKEFKSAWNAQFGEAK